ncbi:hypothetical protein BB559_001491 [Furculomyces boomerangus]|uniref:Uncharacterized protein n=2 Tax=Harpellales TaxID=61421 RepID=A0A2T9Z1R6_9FUNG|nr:hypothetical protein BB559_001491 [Furculomyces boomerangus]PVZ98522.1 hypothetical protein BB558_005490 [Smittium angustum]
MSFSPITSVSEDEKYKYTLARLTSSETNHDSDLVGLEAKDKTFVLSKKILSKFPETLLNNMFPNGLLNRFDVSVLPIHGEDHPFDSTFIDGNSKDSSYRGSYYWVEIEPEMLQYVFDFYRSILYANQPPSLENKGNQSNLNQKQSTKTKASQLEDSDSEGIYIEPKIKKEIQENAVLDDEIVSEFGHKSSDTNLVQGKYTDEKQSEKYTGNKNNVEIDNSEERSDHGIVLSQTQLNLDLPVYQNDSEDIINIGDISDIDISTDFTDSKITSSSENSVMRHYESFTKQMQENSDSDIFNSQRTSVIMLKEDLDYHIIPKNGKTGQISLNENLSMEFAKSECAKILQSDNKIFEPIFNYVDRIKNSLDTSLSDQVSYYEDTDATTPGTIEMQLVELLCASGYYEDSVWECRLINPERTSISSLSIVQMKDTGIPSINNTESDINAQNKRNNQADIKLGSFDSSTSTSSSSSDDFASIAEKMYGFYKKPAVKCWWDKIELNLGTQEERADIILWCRRTWTLELVVI